LVTTSKLTPPRPPNRIPLPSGGKDPHAHPTGHQLTVTKPTASNSEDLKSEVLKLVGLRSSAN
jgi:hypothetical protein